MKQVPPQKQNDARFQWARDRMTWTSKRDTTVFNYEKRVTCDSTDSYKYYFDDLGKANIAFCHRQ